MVCPKCKLDVAAILISKLDPKGGCVDCVIKLVDPPTPAQLYAKGVMR
jgi:hypothetical protein